MLGVKKLCALTVSICLLWFLAVPAFAADPQVTKKDLKGINPGHHKYAFAVIGGAAVGMGIGAAIGGGWGNDITKGLLIGSGASSAFYLHSHRHDDHGRMEELGLFGLLHSLGRWYRLDGLRLQHWIRSGFVGRGWWIRYLVS